MKLTIFSLSLFLIMLSGVVASLYSNNVLAIYVSTTYKSKTSVFTITTDMGGPFFANFEFESKQMLQSPNGKLIVLSTTNVVDKEGHTAVIPELQTNLAEFINMGVAPTDIKNTRILPPSYEEVFSMPSISSEMSAQYAIMNYTSLGRQVINETKRKLLHSGQKPDHSFIYGKSSLISTGDVSNPSPRMKSNKGGGGGATSTSNSPESSETQATWGDDSKMAVLQINYQSMKQSNKPSQIGFNGYNVGLQGGTMFSIDSIEDLQLGFYGAFDQGHTDFSHRISSSDKKSWKLGPIVSWQKNAFSCVGMATYGGETVSQHYLGQKADYRRGQWDVFGYGSYSFDMSEHLTGLTLSPEVELMYIRQEAGSFYAPWVGQQMNTGVTSGVITRLGVLADCFYDGFNYPIALSFSLGWQYNDVNVGKLKTSNLGFVHKNDQSMGNAFYYSWGAKFPVSDFCEIGVGYMGIFSGNYSSYLFRGMVTVSF